MLTDLKIRASKPTFKNYKLQDQQGLCLVVTPTGRKNWRFRYQLSNKRREAGLGAYPEISIIAARKTVFLMREKVLSGIDPIEEKVQAKVLLDRLSNQSSDTGVGHFFRQSPPLSAGYTGVGTQLVLSSR